MDRPISHVLHEFLTSRKILTEVARQIGMKSATLNAELSPTVKNAKFCIDDLVRVVFAIRKIGYGDEFDAILHEYFETLNDYELQTKSTDNLAVLTANLMAKTAALADSTVKLIDSSDDISQLKSLQSMIRSDLLPTCMRLIHTVEKRLGESEPGDESVPQLT